MSVDKIKWACEKHSRILIGKEKCVDCENEKVKHFVCECNGRKHWCTANCPDNEHYKIKPTCVDSQHCHVCQGIHCGDEDFDDYDWVEDIKNSFNRALAIQQGAMISHGKITHNYMERLDCMNCIDVELAFLQDIKNGGGLKKFLEKLKTG